MEHYKLQSDEVVLFKDDCWAIDIVIGKNKPKTKTGELLLTNHNLVIICETEHFFRASDFDTLTYPVDSIKVYNNTPQININANEPTQVYVYLLDEILHIGFDSKKIVKKFIEQVSLLLTGRSAYDGTLDKLKTNLTKVRQTIDTVDETLHIDSVGAVTGIAGAVADTATGGFSSKVKGIAAGVFGAAKSLFGKKQDTTTETQTNSTVQHYEQPSATTTLMENKIIAIKQLKELLDIGAITQEEFEEQKNKILNS